MMLTVSWPYSIWWPNKYTILAGTEENHGKPARVLGQDSNQISPKYEPRALTLGQPTWQEDNVKVEKNYNKLCYYIPLCKETKY
jgi:hypothetical protein